MRDSRIEPIDVVGGNGDSINPLYYKDNSIEPIDVIEDWNLNFNLGNVIKYVARAGKKDDKLTDLKKAKWYIEREINRSG